MDLSMWIFADELSDCECEIMIHDGSRTIKGLRVLSEDGTTMESYVYIGKADSIMHAEAGNTLLLHNNDHIIVKNISMDKVFNRVLSIFEKYARWDERLNSAINSDKPYQNVIDIAHEIFRSPMLFGHKSRKIYAITRQYTDEQVYEGWDELKANLEITENIAKILKKVDFDPKICGEKRQDLDDVQAGAKFKNSIRTNVILNGEIWGHLYMYRYEETVQPAVFQLALYVAEILENILKENVKKSGGTFAELAWISDLLDGKHLSNHQINILNAILGLDGKNSIVLYRLAKKEIDDFKVESWMAERLRDIDDVIVFDYKNELIILERNTAERKGRVLERIKYLTTITTFKCGISYAMRDIKYISVYYRQAELALNAAPVRECGIYYFKDCALMGIVSEFKRIAEWREWVMPELEEMVKTDRTAGTEYFSTLINYLDNNGNLADTSKALFIHRNTLVYRIKKIEGILGVDLNNNMMKDYLKLCCNMVKDTHNRPEEL